MKLNRKAKAIKFFARKIAIVLVPVVITFFLVNRAYDFAVGSWECRVNWTESGMDYKYKFGAGCMISPDGNWVPAKNYRVD